MANRFSLLLFIFLPIFCLGTARASEHVVWPPGITNLEDHRIFGQSLYNLEQTGAVDQSSDSLLRPAQEAQEDIETATEPGAQDLIPIPVYKPVLLSALLPGSGQLYRGQRRGFAYVAAEIVSVTAWAFFKNEGNNNRDEYIDFARVNARETLAANDPWYNVIQDRINPNLQGDWDYYEHMRNYRRSGRYDRDLNNDYTLTGNLRDLDPETEYTDSFNNRQWGIARINYFESDPENPDALVGTSADTVAAKEFYAATATSFDMAWDWGTPEQNPLSTVNWNQYKDIIHDANTAFRRASFSLGLLLANHVISTIDSYISVRTYNSRLGGKDGLGIFLSPDGADQSGPRARFEVVRRF